MGDRAHWDAIYEAREERALTWFEEEATETLALIAERARPGQPIIDVGGGASRLVDGLLARGLGPLTVLDLSDTALNVSRNRLGDRAAQVTWICADVTTWEHTGPFAIWHDRATLHFLTDPADQTAYVARMAAALEEGGHAILATFDLTGPDTCAGLPVQRFSPETLAALLETCAPDAFRAVFARRQIHRTPRGNSQDFQVSVFRRQAISGS